MPELKVLDGHGMVWCVYQLKKMTVSFSLVAVEHYLQNWILLAHVGR